MGDRVSIQFAKKVKNFFDKDNPHEQESIFLFSHWGGMEFAHEALAYAKELKADIESGKVRSGGPLARMEPENVMVDFIRMITNEMERVDGDLYLLPDGEHGDNGDNGHWIVDMDTMKLERG